MQVDGSIAASRLRRTAIAGARAQLASIGADVVNVSSTGALVRTALQQAPGSEWPLLLDVADTPIHLIARVVRCEPVAGPLTTSTGQFMLALAFVNPAAETQAQLDRVCQAEHRDEGDVRRLHVSLVRRCPKCQSRDVAKEGRRNYSCGQCGQVFIGFRVGFLRFAR